MATGTSKTQWNGEKLYTASSNGSMSTPAMQLNYEGKRPEREILQTRPALIKTLWQGGGKDAEAPNRLYYGDNQSVLASLLQEPVICGKVQLIYIDPPFATNSVFQSRTQGDAYHDLLIGSHYIEFLRERLMLLRELLAEDGSIYVHLDENMAFHIKVIMDEIFGRKNFRNWITRKKCNPKTILVKHLETLLILSSFIQNQIITSGTVL